METVTLSALTEVSSNSTWQTMDTKIVPMVLMSQWT